MTRSTAVELSRATCTFALAFAALNLDALPSLANVEIYAPCAEPLHVSAQLGLPAKASASEEVDALAEWRDALPNAHIEAEPLRHESPRQTGVKITVRCTLGGIPFGIWTIVDLPQAVADSTQIRHLTDPVSAGILVLRHLASACA